LTIKTDERVSLVQIFERICNDTSSWSKSGDADNKRFGNRLAEGITIGCSSLSAVVSADEQISAFCIYLRL